MIDALLTGATGRVLNLNRVEPVRPVKQEQNAEQEDAPQSLDMDRVSLSSDAIQLNFQSPAVQTSESENYTEEDKYSQSEQSQMQTAQTFSPQQKSGYGISAYVQAATQPTGSFVNISL